MLFNPLERRGNYSATLTNMKLIHWPLWIGCYIWYSEKATGRGDILNRPLIAVPNFDVTAQPTTLGPKCTNDSIAVFNKWSVAVRF